LRIEACADDVAGGGVTLSVGQATAATGAPLSATVKVLGPTTIMKQVKDTSSAGSVLPARTGTAVVSLQPVLIRPSTPVTVASAASSFQTSTMPTSVVGGVSRTSSAGVIATCASTSLQPVIPAVQQAVHGIVHQAQAQAARQNTVGFVTTSTTAGFAQQAPAGVVGSPSSLGQAVTAIQTAADAAAAAAVAAAASQNKSSPYVMRLRNQRS